MTDLLGNRPLRQMIPAILLTGLLILSFMVISDLLISLIWAVIIAYIMWPPYQWLKFKLKNKANLSAALMSIIIATIISLITFWLITLLQDESKSAYQSLAINFSQEPHQLPSFIIKIPWLGAYLQ